MSGYATGGGSRLVIEEDVITSGNVTFPATAGAWAIMAFPEIAIAAAVGDRVDISAHGMRSQTAGAWLDVAVIVGTTIVRYMSTMTSSPSLEGDPGWYPAVNFQNSTALRGFTVTANDLDGDEVRFMMVANSGGGGTLFSSTDYPFHWRAQNSGQ
jgi:hypothetical protein